MSARTLAEYIRLTRLLQTGRRRDILTDEAEDLLLECMDRTWAKMTMNERTSANLIIQGDKP